MSQKDLASDIGHVLNATDVIANPVMKGLSALSGLVTGLFFDKCLHCGQKVSRRARVCSKCGHGAPKGWTKCPACDKWVGNDSNYCPHCNHPLHPEERIDLAGGIWDRKAGLFAQRFELGDTKRVMKNGLMIQEGTVAVLLDGGKETKVLGPGRHEPQGVLRTINWFGNPPPRSAVMVDAGDVIFRVDYTGSSAANLADDAAGKTRVPLRSAEELAVGASAEVALRFRSSQADAFVANLLKENRKLDTEAICRWLYEESVSAVKDLCLQSTIEDLVKDPDRRERFEDAIARALKEPLARCGLELVRVGAVEFFGPAYEEMRAKYGELEKARRLVEFEKKQLALLAESDETALDAALKNEARDDDAKKLRAKRAQETQAYLDQLAQEKDLAEIDRTTELELAVRVAKGEISRKEASLAAARALEEHAKQMTALANKLELDLTLKNYDREQLLKDAENKAELAAIERREKTRDADMRAVIAGTELTIAEKNDLIERLRIDRELYEADKWLDIKAKKNAVKNDDLRTRAEILSGKSALDLAALEADPAVKAAFLQHELDALKVRTDSTLTPEQLLAQRAGQSDAAAIALARMAEAKEGAAKQTLEELKKAQADRLSHDEKVLEKMAEITKQAVEHQTTVVPPPTTILK